MIKLNGASPLAELALCCVSCFWTPSVLAADPSYLFTTLAGVAGTVISSADGTGSAAQFSAPRGVAVDSAGNVYVADSTNNTIRKITAAGLVTTLAGTAGSSGYKDATGTAAKFNEPFGLVADNAGNLFVADTNNNAIRKITADGVVTTLAGGSGSGTADGTGTAAKFHEPHAVAIDSSGTLYVADYENHMVRKVTSAGVVTTLAGGADISGSVDGQGTAARFMALQGIAVDSTGNVYVTESGNRDVRKISASGLVTTLVGGTGKFGEPRGLALDASGNLYVGDYGSNVVRKVTSTGAVSLYAGTAPTAGSSDGTTTSALFYGPSGVAIDSSNNLYIADTLNNTVRKISASGTVTTLAGLAGRTSSVDGSAATARFEDPYAVAVDGSGNLYVADATDNSIRKVTSDGAVTTLAGKGGSFGSADGTGDAARFKNPLGIAVDTAGNVYVADTGNSTVRKITAGGVVSTLAGSAGLAGSLDATGTAARFMGPYGITVDAAGNVYVVESSAAVRKITAAGVVTTLAGTSGTNGFTNGTGTAARFSVPFDIAVDGAGNLYVSDHGNHAVRLITSAGVVTTLAGSGTAGKADGTGIAASFKFPSGLAADSSGTVYLADTDNQVVRKITTAGVVTTIAGTGSLGSADGVGTAASFYNPKDVAVDPSGNLYVVDRNNHTIRKGTLQTSVPAVPVCTVSASASSINTGSSSTLTASCSPVATSYVWTGGSCSTSTTAICTVTPSSTGTYTVVGVNAGGTGSAASVTVTVAAPTQAVITGTISAIPSSGAAPLAIKFAGTGRSTVTTDVLSYLWNFGDGSTSTEQSPSHTFSTAGTYAVTLTVSNASGQSSSAVAQSITVTAVTPPAVPVCTVSASASTVNAGSSSTLTASCSPAATSYVWTGGTCSTSTNSTCAVTPSSTATYTVAGVNAGGTGSTASVTVTVTPAVSTLIADADKVFVWAEKTYATIFGRGQLTQTITGYRYRSYANGHFLAVNDTGTPRLYYLGPLSDNKPFDLGLLSGWLAQASL